MLRGLFDNPLALIVLLVVILLVFGATRLPALARSLGQSTKILKDELKDGSKSETKTESTAATPAPDSTTTSSSDNRSS